MVAVSLTHAFMVLIYGYNFFVRVIYYLRYKLPDKLLETPLHYKETDIRKLPISTCAISVLLKLYSVLKKQLDCLRFLPLVIFCENISSFVSEWPEKAWEAQLDRKVCHFSWPCCLGTPWLDISLSNLHTSDWRFKQKTDLWSSFKCFQKNSYMLF